MRELLLEYRTAVVAPDGCAYVARACGGPAHDGTKRWHGWIEFVRIDDGTAIRTGRETSQPGRACTVYWSTGLTPVYLLGALERALRLSRGQGNVRDRTVGLDARNGGPGPREPTVSGTRMTTAAIACPLELTPFDRRFLRGLGIAPE